MKCEHCIYCHCSQTPESYDETWWCERGYGSPEDGMGCKHIFWFAIKDFLLFPLYRLQGWIQNVKKYEGEEEYDD